MTFAAALLNAEHIGIRDLREHLSGSLKEERPLVVTDHGQPKKIILSYEDAMELVDILDELQDAETLKTVAEAKRAIRPGAKGVSVSRLFSKIRKNLSKAK